MKNRENDGGYHSAIGAISPDFFLVKKRFNDEKLLRLDNRLLETSEKVLIDVGGRLDNSAVFGGREDWPIVGDTALRRPEIDPLGVLKFRLGNNPNCALCEDMEDAERGDAIVGDMAAPCTDE